MAPFVYDIKQGGKTRSGARRVTVLARLQGCMEFGQVELRWPRARWSREQIQGDQSRSYSQGQRI